MIASLCWNWRKSLGLDLSGEWKYRTRDTCLLSALPIAPRVKIAIKALQLESCESFEDYASHNEFLTAACKI